MKKIYVKPTLEIEQFELNANIAGNCGSVISFGPGDDTNPMNRPVCKEFEGAFDVEIASVFSTKSSGNTPFYENGGQVMNGAVCDCYYSSGGNVYFTS